MYRYHQEVITFQMIPILWYMVVTPKMVKNFGKLALAKVQRKMQNFLKLGNIWQYGYHMKANHFLMIAVQFLAKMDAFWKSYGTFSFKKWTSFYFFLNFAKICKLNAINHSLKCAEKFSAIFGTKFKSFSWQILAKFKKK